MGINKSSTEAHRAITGHFLYPCGAGALSVKPANQDLSNTGFQQISQRDHFLIPVSTITFAYESWLLDKDISHFFLFSNKFNSIVNFQKFWQETFISTAQEPVENTVVFCGKLWGKPVNN
ncbi:hypothetical protein J5X98_03410 [Leptothermofonsia sichuanensis E412]|uniref:hypothetical protein n=1 Tax=Leptothermofonsia sichuanensis TaxID=2917832 RepID=UPI001CA76F95|nr:hypothetical protein [Leptothermofonsia sichuanensis]QZZ21525.1 hypothetical protein J5X98_03410 [Leptothermofonsia sichuanensis E412]